MTNWQKRAIMILTLLGVSLMASGCSPVWLVPFLVKRKRLHLPEGHIAKISRTVDIPVVFRDKTGGVMREGYVRAHRGYMVGLPPRPEPEEKGDNY